MPETTSFTFKITSEQASELRRCLADQNFEFRELPYALYGAKKGKLNVNAYSSGKLLVQGKGAQEFVEFTLEPQILGEARLGYEEVHQPEMFEPHAGIDESGKGDFFGPLVIAGVFVDGETSKALLELGVRDSKRIGSDRRVEALAEGIEEVVRGANNVVLIGPTKYNELYGKFGNLNRLLAWGHATVIENLLNQVPHCPRALSDQFANPSLIRQALKEKGRGIQLDQRTKAESDVAVAAASILARARFVQAMKKLGDEVGVALPKGASAQVKSAAREIIANQGIDALKRVAKRHFKTFDEVAGA